MFNQPHNQTQNWLPPTVALLVAATGLLTLSSTLEALLHIHHSHIVDTDTHFTVLAGLSLIYLATLLRRGKHTAWLISLVIYVFLAVRNIRHFDFDLSNVSDYGWLHYLNLIAPIAILALLILGRHYFTVRSEVLNIVSAGRRALLILLIALLYGIIGFQLLDTRDFHQEISLLTGAHYTIDQFGLTTNELLIAYTHRAQLFLDSLAAISLGALFYVGISLFAPIRFRLSNHQKDYDEVKDLLERYPNNSEDFFKLWPRDKAYYFDPTHHAVIAYKVNSGVALAVGDPVGDRRLFENTLRSFFEFCRVNDWQPAFVHTLSDNIKLIKKIDPGLEAQKLGEEAIVDLQNFTQKVGDNKYFRHINNKFTKLGYTSELFKPPHSPDLIKRLKEISDNWLEVPGRGERSFMMGYFNEAYMQQCNIMVVRDQAGTIQAFINQLPSFNNHEANYDFLRHTKGSPGNINDFLVLNFIGHLKGEGYKYLNMGLCPLSGLAERPDNNYDVIDGLLHLIYENTSRFYSFKGLRRFKEKYEPQWRDRYLIYSGGVVGLTKTGNALMSAMRLPKKTN